MDDLLKYLKDARGREIDTGRFRKSVRDSLGPKENKYFDEALAKLDLLAEQYKRTQDPVEQKGLERKVDITISDFLGKVGITNGNRTYYRCCMFRHFERRRSSETGRAEKPKTA